MFYKNIRLLVILCVSIYVGPIWLPITLIIKMLCETEQNCNILTPTLLAITPFLSRSPGLLNRGAWGPASLGAGFLHRILSPTHLISNWLTSSLHTGYIMIWRQLFFLRASQSHSFNPSTVKVIISWYSSTGCTCYLRRCISYFDSPVGSEGNMQQKWCDLFCFRFKNSILE